ncbi:MAG: hypothetical protein GF364_00930 [Candidatus Lokiarchaeota archaeon]|nr:hypothetical protein [Candidatus Lokiarchaeota archaeon]
MDEINTRGRNSILQKIAPLLRTIMKDYVTEKRMKTIFGAHSEQADNIAMWKERSEDQMLEFFIHYLLRPTNTDHDWSDVVRILRDAFISGQDAVLGLNTGGSGFRLQSYGGNPILESQYKTEFNYMIPFSELQEIFSDSNALITSLYTAAADRLRGNMYLGYKSIDFNLGLDVLWGEYATKLEPIYKKVYTALSLIPDGKKCQVKFYLENGMGFTTRNKIDSKGVYTEQHYHISDFLVKFTSINDWEIHKTVQSILLYTSLPGVFAFVYDRRSLSNHGLLFAMSQNRVHFAEEITGVNLQDNRVLDPVASKWFDEKWGSELKAAIEAIKPTLFGQEDNPTIFPLSYFFSPPDPANAGSFLEYKTTDKEGKLKMLQYYTKKFIEFLGETRIDGDGEDLRVLFEDLTENNSLFDNNEYL